MIKKQEFSALVQNLGFCSDQKVKLSTEICCWLYSAVISPLLYPTNFNIVVQSDAKTVSFSWSRFSRRRTAAAAAAAAGGNGRV